MWLSKRLSDGKSSEVTYHRLLPGQQLQFDELWQVLAADAVRRLTKEEELNLKPERLLRMRWVTREVHRRWRPEGKSAVGHFGISASRTYKCTDSSTCALHTLRVHFGDASSAFLQTSASEEYQELTIKAPPEVGYLFSDSEGKPARYVRLLTSFYGLTSAPRAWWLDITQKLSQLGWKPMSTDQCLWCRYSNDGDLKGVIGIHVDDFLIGLADGEIGDDTNKFITEAPITR